MNVISSSLLLPSSRRKKFVGIRPAAADFCLYSTVNGIKLPELGLDFATAVTITDVSPNEHIAVPFANRAYLPAARHKSLL